MTALPPPEPAGLGRKRLLWLVLIVLLVAVDQWTKEMARDDLRDRPPIRFAGGLLSLVYAENEGAFLSLGSSLPASTRHLIFTVAVGVAVAVALIVLFLGRIQGGDAIAVALIGGGGVGNLIDRVMQDGRVTDFLFMKAGPLQTGVFNIADMGITGGVVWLMIGTFFASKKETAAPKGEP